MQSQRVKRLTELIHFRLVRANISPWALMAEGVMLESSWCREERELGVSKRVISFPRGGKSAAKTRKDMLVHS